MHGYVYFANIDSKCCILQLVVYIIIFFLKVLVACMDMFTSPMPLQSPVPCIQGAHKQIKDEDEQSCGEEGFC